MFHKSTESFNTKSELFSSARNFSPIGISAIATLAARADVVYARNLLSTTSLKGTLSEYFAERFFLSNSLENNISGKWFSLTPRTGPQGLDFLFMRIRPNGQYEFMVGESKFGLSKLGFTNDGRQMSFNWTTARLQKIGQGYRFIANNDCQLKKLPQVPPKKQFDVPINGTIRSFWQDDKGNWFFSGSQEELPYAKKISANISKNLLSPSCTVRGRIFHVEKVGNDLKITLYKVDVTKITESTTLNKLQPSSDPLIIKDLLTKKISHQELKKQITLALKTKLNLSDAELRELSEDICRKYKNGDLLKSPTPIWKSIASQSAFSAGFAAIIDIGFQYATNRVVDLRKTSITAISTGVGTISGELVSIWLLKNPTLVRETSQFLGLGGFSLARNSLSGTAGGFAAGIVFAYGGLIVGLYDTKTANRIALSNSIGFASGNLVGLGVTTLIANFGTTGTGTAISSLSGAAATNATMAWLGLGTASSGGFGVVGGTIVLGGVVAVVAIGVSTAAMFIFHKIDESKDREYYIQLEQRYIATNAWASVAQRYFQLNLISPGV